MSIFVYGEMYSASASSASESLAASASSVAASASEAAATGISRSVHVSFTSLNDLHLHILIFDSIMLLDDDPLQRRRRSDPTSLFCRLVRFVRGRFGHVDRQRCRRSRQRRQDLYRDVGWSFGRRRRPLSRWLARILYESGGCVGSTFCFCGYIHGTNARVFFSLPSL